MKLLFAGIISFIALPAFAHTVKDSTIKYELADSIKAVQFTADVKVTAVHARKEGWAGIRTDLVQVCLESEKGKKEVVFEFPKNAAILATGLNIGRKEKGELTWKYDWKTGETYRLLLSIATDSAENYLLYSGYIWLPEFNKWKLIGTCKITGNRNMIKQPAATIASSSQGFAGSVNNAWIQRSNNSWKQLENRSAPNPVINLLSHVDSIEQFNIETEFIRKAIANGTTDVRDNVEGVYYKIIREGTGRQVTVNDTVTAYYRLTFMNDTAVIDQAKDKPATFPLKRLIRGWQIGLPLIRTGGKIKLVIPSAHAYSIRTRSPDIPPNSILEFEVEVVDAKSPL